MNVSLILPHNDEYYENNLIHEENEHVFLFDIRRIFLSDLRLADNGVYNGYALFCTQDNE